MLVLSTCPPACCAADGWVLLEAAGPFAATRGSRSVSRVRHSRGVYVLAAPHRSAPQYGPVQSSPATLCYQRPPAPEFPKLAARAQRRTSTGTGMGMGIDRAMLQYEYVCHACYASHVKAIAGLLWSPAIPLRAPHDILLPTVRCCAVRCVYIISIQHHLIHCGCPPAAEHGPFPPPDWHCSRLHHADRIDELIHHTTTHLRSSTPPQLPPAWATWAPWATS
jgi:hypothetical protein